MKQSPLLFPPCMEEDETIVSRILLDLKSLMSLSESLSNFNWTRRKRRSCLNPPPPLLPTPLPSVHQIKKITDRSGDRTTASPDTPLSFSPGDSDDKPSHSSKKRTRDEYMDRIHELNQRKVFLRGEIETVKHYYHKLKAFNSELKAVKHEMLISCARKETRMNLVRELPQDYRMSIVRHCPPSIGDQTAQICQSPFGPIINGVESVNHLGRLGIDLNMPAEEMDASQPLDGVADRRARFAEARRKRRGIIKIKSMRNASGLKIASKPRI